MMLQKAQRQLALTAYIIEGGVSRLYKSNNTILLNNANYTKIFVIIKYFVSNFAYQ